MGALDKIMNGDKLIDFDCDGEHYVTLYIGNAEIENWFGDDWDDSPYECNAGIVYHEYCDKEITLAIPEDAKILEPCYKEWYSAYSKDDMKDRKVPMLVIGTDEDLALAYNFGMAVANERNTRIYMGDNALDSINEIIRKYRGVIVSLKED